MSQFAKEKFAPKPPYDLGKRIEQAGLTKNEIANITGISNTYLKLIESGEVGRIGRDKILAIAMVALNLPIRETNEILKAHGWSEVDELDANLLMQAAENRSITGMQSIHSLITFDLLMLSMERLPGDTYLIYKTPHVATMSHDYVFHIKRKYEQLYTSLDESLYRIYSALSDHFHHRRGHLFHYALKNGHKINTLVCHQCMVDYIALGREHAELKKHILKHVRETIKCIMAYPGVFNMKLIGMCPRLFVQIKELPKQIKEHSKVVFMGQDQPHMNYFDERIRNLTNLGHIQNNIVGFATDHKQVFQKYLDEYHRLTETEIPISDMPDYLQSLVKTHLGVDQPELMAE